ncbi:hypothetical protein [Pseudomonas sp. ArH3a]|nr:hypothetical protein [Pseudomonas sp. ArH3a]
MNMRSVTHQKHLPDAVVIGQPGIHGVGLGPEHSVRLYASR